MSTIENKLVSLGLELPVAPPPVGSYVPVLQTGKLVITSGQLPFIGRELAFAGKVGSDLDVQDGWNAARLCAVNALAQIKACLGNLDQVARVVRVEGYVNSAPGFHAQPQVVNGASELFTELFGDAGKHTRIAVGVAELPLNAAVEVAVWVEAIE
ncbi:MAG: RidA family protein [Planctomycetaceae bacterium]|nr:RidA family protein [Planctomycetaceae bacterium]